MEFHNIDFRLAKVLVVGDVMLDQYWFGGTSRISPEAPVPVVLYNRMDERPGGAANVALGIAALGAEPYLLGVTGEDAESLHLERLLKNHGVSYHFEKAKQAATITKRRILSRNQQMLRLDMEHPFDQSTASLLKKKYSELLSLVDIVILSDYGKGTLQEAPWFIQAAKAHSKPVLIDPKSSDFGHYRGASIITPNLKEFEAVVGPCASIEIMVEKAKQLLEKYELEALVITRSEQGMSVVSKTEEVKHIPAVAREVHDVTGAGDTVMSVLGAALASGVILSDAANLGNIAAGIAVGKLGTATVTTAEILNALGANTPIPFGVMTEQSLLAALRISKALGEKIVFTNGCFDILHAGHVMYLEEAKRLGNRVIVGVNDDLSVARLKGSNRPINCLEDRMHVLAGLQAVDWVVPFSEDTPLRLIKNISPHILVKGGDYQASFGEDISTLPGAEFVLSEGGEVKLLSVKQNVSTTRTIEKIITQHPELARETN